MLLITARPGCVRFSVRVQPRSSSSEIVGVHAGALKIRLTAPPIDGAANHALIEFLAERLDVPRSAVRIVAGVSSRTKTIEITGISADAAEHLAGGTRAK